MQEIIGVDLDEVLSETIDSVLKIINYKINGKEIKKEDLTSYYLHENIGLGLKQEDSLSIFFQLRNSDEKWNVKPIKGALEKLKELKFEGYNFVIVTARREILREYSQKWVEKNYPGIFNEIIFTEHLTENEVSKSEICKQKGIKIMIEDNLEYSIELARAGIKVYLLDKPWNRHYDPGVNKGIEKIYSWDELEIK